MGSGRTSLKKRKTRKRVKVGIRFSRRMRGEGERKVKEGRGKRGEIN